MNWYRNYKDQWQEIIGTVAAEERRVIQMIEKDTIQSMFLLEISKSELPLCLKAELHYQKHMV